MMMQLVCLSMSAFKPMFQCAYIAVYVFAASAHGSLSLCVSLCLSDTEELF